MQYEFIILICMLVFIIGYVIFCTLSDIPKKERKTKVFQAKTEREILQQIKDECKVHRLKVYEIVPLQQVDNDIKVIVIFEHK